VAKGRCPSCSAGLKAKRRFCQKCGKRNPLFASPARAVKTIRPVLVKSAPSAADVRFGLAHRAAITEPDPGVREVHIRQMLGLMKGRAA